MVRRLSEKPLRIGFSLTESGANTFTTEPLNLPSIPSIAVSRGDAKAIGVEVMKVLTSMDGPDPEAAQNNTVQGMISKGPAPTAILGAGDQRAIMTRTLRTRSVTGAAGEVVTPNYQQEKLRDLSDGDGNGEIVADNEIHVSVVGGGNANAKAVSGYMLYHLVELDRNEALFELIETAQ